MRLFFALAACASVAASLWVTAGELAVTQSGPHGVRLAMLPPLWLLALLAIAVALVAWLARRLASRFLPLVGVLLVLLPWLPVAVPPVFLIWTGPLRLWLWAATVVAVLLAVPVRLDRLPRWWTEPQRAALAAGGLALVIYGLSSWAVAPQLPGGDEPHYLVITQSLLYDHTLQVQAAYQSGDYHAFYGGTLKPDYLQRGQNGQIYSIHAPGLPALILPAFALFGYPGVKAFLVLMAALGGWLLWRALYAFVLDPMAAWFGWAAVGLSVPFFFHTFTVFPDGPGAVLVLIGVLPLVESVSPVSAAPSIGRAWKVSGWPDTWRWLLRGAAVAFLPWLHSRFSVAAGFLGLCLLWEIARRPQAWRRAAAFMAVPIVSAIGWFSYFYVIYGTPNPSAPYGTYTQTSLANMVRGIPGLLFDQQFGLLPNAPVYLFAIVGLLWLLKRHRRLAIQLLAIQVPYALVVAAYQMWWGGSSSPARFLVAVLLPMAFPAAFLFARARRLTTRALGVASLFLSLAITASMVLARRGALAYNFRDSLARWLLWVAPLVNLPRGVPSLFVTDPPHIGAILAQAGVWGLVLAAAAAGLYALERRRVPRAVLVTAVPLAGALVATVALPVVWQMNHLHRTAVVTAAPAQIAFLRRFDPARRGIGLEYSPLHRIPYEAVPAQMFIGPSLPDLPPEGTPLLGVYSPPPGVYRLDVKTWRRGTGTVTVAIDSTLPPVVNLHIRPSDPPTMMREIRLPVAVPGLVIDADAAARGLLDHAWLQPLSLAPPDDPFAGMVPRQSARYGPALVFLLHGDAYMEGGGAWVEGGRQAEFAIAPDAGVPVHLLLRNAPVPNDVTLTSGLWQVHLHLAPQEERLIEVPEARNAPAVPLRIATTAGFRPYLVEPGSTDHRFLGCWIETR